MQPKSLASTVSDEKTEIEDARNTYEDTVDMQRVGKIQLVRRNFGFWTVLGLTTSMLATWEGVYFANTTAMINGGPASLVYGFIYTALGALMTAASLAEMASMYPTSGGQYHWTAMLAPEKYKVFLSWLCGWISCGGWLANACAGAFFVGTMIQGILVLDYPGYEYHRWHGTLLIYAAIFVAFIVNSVGTRLLAMVEGVIFVLHITAFVALLVPLLYFSDKGSSAAVWGTFTDAGGWGSDGLAWWVGLIGSNLVFIGVDGPAHLSEEVANAATVVPRAMIGTVLINAPLGWAVCIAFSYCIVPTFKAAINSPTGYDYMEVFYAAVGPAGMSGMASVLILMVWFATLNFLATASRQTWAFARDRGLPFSNYFGKVNRRLALPLRAITVCSLIVCMIALINIGSTAAFNAIVSLTEAGLFMSYFIPITLIMGKKIRGEEVKYGPWKMPKALGLFTNGFAAVFLVLSTFFSFFPPATPVTLVTMNWSIVVFSGFVILGLAWYAIRGRKQYHGPVVERAVVSVEPKV